LNSFKVKEWGEKEIIANGKDIIIFLLSVACIPVLQEQRAA
jgi:hypothetical protein